METVLEVEAEVVNAITKGEEVEVAGAVGEGAAIPRETPVLLVPRISNTFHLAKTSRISMARSWKKIN